MLMAVFVTSLELLSPLIYFACATLSVFLLNCLESFLASLNLISSINFLSFPRETPRRLIEAETIAEMIAQLRRRENNELKISLNVSNSSKLRVHALSIGKTDLSSRVRLNLTLACSMNRCDDLGVLRKNRQDIRFLSRETYRGISCLIYEPLIVVIVKQGRQSAMV